MKEIGIYVHIPFCKRKCYYCDFVSYDNKYEKIDSYVETVKKEIEDTSNEFTKNHIVSTIYFGGGTPSFLESKYIKLLLENIRRNFNVSSNAEITLEVNPGTITEEKLKTYQMCGINRLSIGLQTTNDNLLKKIGRIHTYSEFLSTYNLARKLGFSNINVDLIFSLPDESLDDLKLDLEKIIELSPEHISTYSLIVENGTKIKELIEENDDGYNLPSEDIERQMYWYIKNTLEEKGYRHYEISNFTKEGYESKHNLNCWNQKEYFGFGAAAHSFIDGIRFSNKKILSEYIFNFKSRDIEEKMNREELAKEYMMLGLRKIDGVSISEFERKFNLNPLLYFRFEISKLTDEDLIEVDLDDIKLTKKGLDFANIVWEEFI